MFFYAPTAESGWGVTQLTDGGFQKGEVLQEEVSAWKEFFKRLELKESGDRTHVETFAVAFVKDKLSTELSNFVPKDRQRYGYDLEARRLTDKSLVKIETKGRKKEEAIELTGNEPVAAQQAKSNRELFWVCIVPGIPEHPELWVVDNPTDIGEYSTLTLSIDKWKTHGRRLA